MANPVLPIIQIQDRIRILRGHRVLLDADLAAFYGISTKVLNQAVKRNRGRFPTDFLFQIDGEEHATLRSQFVTSKDPRGGRQYHPFAFTEHGALMAATILNSERAVQTSLLIVRAFVALRQMAVEQKEIAQKLAELEARIGGHDEQIAEIIEGLRQILAPPDPEHGRKIGFVYP